MERPILRRDFLAGGAALAGGVLASGSAPHLAAAEASDTRQVPGPEDRLRALGIELPPGTGPSPTLVSTVQVGELLFTSGHVARRPEGGLWAGKLGADMDVEQGQAAARATALGLLGSVRDALGSLDRVVRVVKVLGMVNSTQDFVQQPQVVNGFSSLLIEIFGEDVGRGARSAVGVASLPGGVAVEVEAVLQVRS